MLFLGLYSNLEDRADKSIRISLTGKDNTQSNTLRAYAIL